MVAEHLHLICADVLSSPPTPRLPHGVAFDCGLQAAPMNVGCGQRL